MWLLFVACLRGLSVYLGYFNPARFQTNVFTAQPKEVNRLAARLFSVWTLVTCACCVTAALHPDSQPVYAVTIFSFLVALGFFALETFVYRTVRPPNLLPMLFIASLSSGWMWVEFPYGRI